MFGTRRGAVATIVASCLLVATGGGASAGYNDDQSLDDVEFRGAEEPPEVFENLPGGPEDYSVTIGEDVFDPDARSKVPMSESHEPSNDANSRASWSGTPTWASCGYYDKKTKLVRSYNRQKISGHAGVGANLKCGTSKWGYRHIAGRHASQWRAKSSWTGGDWREMAAFATRSTLKASTCKWYKSSNRTFQYVAQVNLVNKKTGRIDHRFWTRVVVSKSTNNIITTYPQSKSSC